MSIFTKNRQKRQNRQNREFPDSQTVKIVKIVSFDMSVLTILEMSVLTILAFWPLDCIRKKPGEQWSWGMLSHAGVRVGGGRW